MQSKENLPERTFTKAKQQVEINSANTNKLLKPLIHKGSNRLCEAFINELLYILGLTEYKEVEQCNGSKFMISRLQAKKRQPGALLELAMAQIESNNKFVSLPDSKGWCKTLPERHFHVAIQLCITWIERVLFLKLLEAQLFKNLVEKDDYSILNLDQIQDFGLLNNLFFQLTTTKPAERSSDIIKLFSRLPFLKTTLYTATALEQQTIHISELANNIRLPLFMNTTIEAEQASPGNESLTTLSYLLKFLKAFDFNIDSSKETKDSHATNQITEDTAPSSPVCYMNSPELRDEFIIPAPQPLLNMHELQHRLDYLLISCFGADTMKMVKTDQLGY